MNLFVDKIVFPKNGKLDLILGDFLKEYIAGRN